MPQKVRTARVDKMVDVFFRVSRVFEKSVVEVLDGDTVIASFKREHMAPGEMEHILLTKAQLTAVTGGTATVAAKEA